MLEDLFGRIGPTATRAVDGLGEDALTARLDPRANTIAWLAWHLARGQDAQVAAAVGRDQVWTRDGWAGRFALPTDDDLDRVVDEAWDPPVTLGVRLVSVAVDSLQHAGQAAYVRGVLERNGHA